MFGGRANRRGGANGTQVLHNVYQLHHTLVRWSGKTARGIGDLPQGEPGAVDRGLGYGIMLGDGIASLQNLGQSISHTCRTGLWANAASRPFRRVATVPRGPLPESVP